MAETSTQRTSMNIKTVLLLASLLRLILLIYGGFQDALSPVKYTDIDYFVFTDAARFVFEGKSPYLRETYRYTPLLAWLLLPAAWSNWSFSFGKILFAFGDIIAGWLIFLILNSVESMSQEKAVKFASVWLLNPMVAQISTRGSSEGLLGAIVTSLLWAALGKHVVICGILLGFSVHFKIYPVIYGLSILLSLTSGESTDERSKGASKYTNLIITELSHLVTVEVLTVAVISLITFFTLNVLMYLLYQYPFVVHSYLYHFTRIDHRHNFSVYNLLLYMNSSPAGKQSLQLQSLAFFPQLALAAVTIPAILARIDLPSTLLAQTFAFVAFNKYFLWYLVLLPYYLPFSSFLRTPSLGIAAVILWIVGQALWLHQGYRLEFLGLSTFIELWASSLLFFSINVWILGIIILDVRTRSYLRAPVPGSSIQPEKVD